MSWHFSQALEAAYSEAISSGGGQFALSNLTPTHGTFWSPGKTTDVSRRSRSGMTYERSMDGHGATLLTWFLEASRVRTSAPPEEARVSAESAADSGKKWLASLEKSGPDSYSWKTRQYSLAGGLESFSGTWPRWGMMRGGECWELTTPGHLIKGTGSGSGQMWPTPRSCTAMAATITPEAIQKLIDGTAPEIRHKQLESFVTMFPTPTVNDSKNNNPPSQANRNTPPLNSVAGGALNPNWVEWLMGWPLGWTDCDASAMDKCRRWCASHGALYKEA